MNYVFIGILVNSHGIKGEVRLLSDFELKDQVFVPKFKLYLGKAKEAMVVNTYRKHKNFDMVTFEGFNNINDILKYKGDYVYVNRDELNIANYLKDDLIDMEVYTNKLIGKVTSIMKSKAHDILVINNGAKRYLVPLNEVFIASVDIASKKIHINDMEGLINEN